MPVSFVLAALLVNLVESSSPPAIAHSIAHCREQNGSLLFTDPPCPKGAVRIDWRTKPTTVIDFATPTIQRQKTSQKKKIGKQRLHKHKAGKPLDPLARCKQVKSDLKVLRAERRRGYSLAEAAQLDRQLAELKSERRKAC